MMSDTKKHGRRQNDRLLYSDIWWNSIAVFVLFCFVTGSCKLYSLIPHSQENANKKFHSIHSHHVEIILTAVKPLNK
jgi:hypothetical protein